MDTAAVIRTAVGVLVLIAVACLALSIAGIEQRRAVATASVRALAQLALVAAALRGVFAAPVTVIAVVAVMFTVAVWTAGRRLRAHDDAMRAVAVSCAAGSAVAIAVIVGLPTLTRDVRTLVAVSGIVIGGTMTAATLAGRRLADSLHRRRDELEAWLSLGATPRQAVRPLAREAAFESLVPRAGPDPHRRPGDPARRIRRRAAGRGRAPSARRGSSSSSSSGCCAPNRSPSSP